MFFTKLPLYFKILNSHKLTINKTNNQDIYPLTLEIKSYTELACLLSSLIHISQEALFIQEDKCTENIRIDIYNLLNLANRLIPFAELEPLDKNTTV